MQENSAEDNHVCTNPHIIANRDREGIHTICPVLRMNRMPSCTQRHIRADQVIVNLDEIVKLPAVYRHYRKYKWVKDLTVYDGAE